MKRTDYCGRINKKYLYKEIVMCGWIRRRRDFGNLIFFQLRDKTGIIQLVIDPKRCSLETITAAEKLKNQDVIEVKGLVIKRTEENINTEMKTGEFEVLVSYITILNKSKLPPFEIEDRINVSENLRLKYRYLDLRRPFMSEIIDFRYSVLREIRNFLHNEEFVEVETPFLIKSTPEGARDFVVPSRLYQGRFYALPQSPQLFKQLLMVSGVDKYYQIARCFRDEDARADRQTDFTQLDMEMSFVDEEDIFSFTEKLLYHVFKETLNIEIKIPFERLNYDDVIELYGTDKPVRTGGMQLKNISSEFQKSEFKVFESTVNSGGTVKCFVLKNKADIISRKKIKEYEKIVKKHKAKGLAWVKNKSNKFEGGISKFILDKYETLKLKLNLEENDIVFFGAGERNMVNTSLGALRLFVINEFELRDEDQFDFFWVKEFPLFEKLEDGSYEAKHHLFSMPTEKSAEFIDKAPEKVYGKLYDLVCNGNEIASGSIRNHEAQTQKKIMKITGMSDEEINKKFGFFLEAFEYGAPPHGGIAPGIDRLIMVMKKLDNLKDVIAFPKTNNQLCLLTEAPSELSPQQLAQLGLKLDEK
ncbi:MAG: aspartate--tRNA ligase [Candidatus Muiribacteriota bacterium]